MGGFNTLGARLVLTLEAMHDEDGTQRSVMGHESQLGKLAKVLGEAGGE